MTGHMGFSAGFRRSLGLCIIGPGALAGWYNFFHFSPAGLQNDAGKLGVNRRIGSPPVPEFSPSPPPSHPAPGAGAALPPVRLKVLHLEDNEGDHALVTAHLRRGGIEADITRVETEIALLEALAEDWDLSLSALLAIEANRTRIAKQRADHALTRSRQQLRELAQHLQTSIEQERAAIAREIHDDVGGALTAVKFDLAWIARHAPTPEIAERVQQALESIGHAHEASQRIMHNLRPAILEQGLVAALQWMAERFGKRTGIETTFRTSHEKMQLAIGVPLVAYSFAQEALTNVSKHAQATKVSVDVSQAGGVLSIEVTDNGRGLSPEDLAKARSFGIRGLHERAETVGGWVDLSSRPGVTSLILSVPLSGPENGFIDRLLRGLDANASGGDPDRDNPTAWGNL